MSPPGPYCGTGRRRILFLSLHGHTPGRRPVDPPDALASLLQVAGVTAQQIPPGLEARTALWRDRLAGKQLLLVLDDAVDSEQVRPLLPGTAGSLVLVTSRRHLTALEDATAISLDTLSPGEATSLLIRLVDRPGLTGDEPAVAELSRICGYLPLALGMVARQLHCSASSTASAARSSPAPTPSSTSLTPSMAAPRATPALCGSWRRGSIAAWCPPTPARHSRPFRQMGRWWRSSSRRERRATTSGSWPSARGPGARRLY